MKLLKTKGRKVGVILGVIVILLPVVINWRQKSYELAVQANCRGQLYAIHTAKRVVAQEQSLTNGAMIATADLVDRLGYPVPSCRTGSNYVVGKIGELPRCPHTNRVFGIQKLFPFIEGPEEDARVHSLPDSFLN